MLPKPVDVWLAYGDNIDNRTYTKECLNKIKIELDKFDCRYWHCGLNKSGNPKHPLYRRSTTKLQAAIAIHVLKNSSRV